MCRFCGCELSKPELSKKCAYKKDNTEYEVPWSTNSSFVDYQPSNCLMPKDGLPVMVYGQHLKSSEKRLFCPMYWTLIPSWYKSDLKYWKAVTHNARVESLFDNKIYSVSLSEGNRCVVPMEGFYEYKKTDPVKKADVYYFSSSQKNNLLKAAGLFAVTKLESEETLYSCTIITTEAEACVSNIHSRIPLFLNDDNDIEAWLNYKSISSRDAVSKVKSNQNQRDLIYHRVPKVGSKELLNDKKAVASKSIMSNWLNRESRKRKAED